MESAHRWSRGIAFVFGILTGVMAVSCSADVTFDRFGAGQFWVFLGVWSFFLWKISEQAVKNRIDEDRDEEERTVS